MEREGRTRRKREHICLHDSVHLSDVVEIMFRVFVNFLCTRSFGVWHHLQYHKQLVMPVVMAHCTTLSSIV